MSRNCHSSRETVCAGSGVLRAGEEAGRSAMTCFSVDVGHCRIDRSSGRLRREQGLLKIPLALSVSEPCVLLLAYSLRRNLANNIGGAKSNMGIRSQVREGEVF